MRCKDIEYADIKNLMPYDIASLGILDGRKKKKRAYVDCIATFDIETSRIKIEDADHAILYLFTITLFRSSEDYSCYVGRDFDDLRYFIKCVNSALTGNQRLLLFIHNLSYEFQFLRTVCDFDTAGVFCLDSRKILKADIGDHIECRCSYIHSNMSLEKFTEKMMAAHKKQDGETFDYKAIRYPWTVLTEEQLYYALCDTLGLAEALYNEMSADGDTLYTLPLTSTGYVRRDVRSAMANAQHRWIGSLLPNLEVYTLLREAFRGGNTHANRYFAGRVLENVYSFDRKSSYPDVQCNRKFPMTPFKEYPNADIDDLLRLLTVRGRAILARIALHNVELRDPYWGCPYISQSMCRRLEGGIFDNGRVLSAEYLECALTDIDLRIICDEYKAEIVPIDVYTAGYGYLPPEYVAEVQKFFRFKTELDGVAGQEFFYMKSKNKLNAIYGMSAQDPAKETILFINDEFQKDPDFDLERALKHYNKTAFMPYQWGVWTTAWARFELEEGIKLAGHGFVYGDTDSVKSLIRPDLDGYNKQAIARSKESGAFATSPDGTVHYMGVYEQEKTYSKFATLGSKKYAYQYEDGNTHVTIAGVTKKKGGQELDKGDELGKGLDRFINTTPGFIFENAGGVEAVYVDTPPCRYLNIDDHRLEIGPCVVLKDSTYQLGITAEYERLLNSAADVWGYTGEIQ